MNYCFLLQVDHEYSTTHPPHPTPRTCWRDIIVIFPCFEKLKETLTVAVLSDNVNARSFLFWMVITFLGVYIFLVDLKSLTVYRSQVCQIDNCKLCFLAHIKKCQSTYVSVRLPGWLFEYGKHFNLAIFSDTIILINKLCLAVILIQL